MGQNKCKLFMNLPNEIVERILLHVKYPHIKSCVFVSKQFNTLLQKNRFWKNKLLMDFCFVANKKNLQNRILPLMVSRVKHPNYFMIYIDIYKYLTNKKISVRMFVA